MVEKIKNGAESKGFFDNIKDSISRLKDQIFDKSKQENLENKKNIVALKELENKIIDQKLRGLDEKQNKVEKTKNGSKFEKVKPDFVSKNNIYLGYGKNSNNPIDKIRGEEADNLVESVKNYKDQKNVIAFGTGWVINKLLG